MKTKKFVIDGSASEHIYMTIGGVAGRPIYSNAFKQVVCEACKADKMVNVSLKYRVPESTIRYWQKAEAVAGGE